MNCNTTHYRANSSSVPGDPTGYAVRVHQHLPDVDPSIARVLAAAGVRAGDPLVILDNELSGQNLVPVWSAGDGEGRLRRQVVPRCWVPTCPMALCLTLDQTRREVYFARFVERRRAGGWLLETTEEISAKRTWFLPLIQRTHVPGRTYTTDQWRLTWYDYRGDDAVARAGAP